MIITSNMHSKIFLLALVVMSFVACVNDIEEVNALLEEYNPSVDIGSDVRILYSDSGYVKIIIEGAVLEQHNDLNNPNQTFPAGIFVTFLDVNEKPHSWLKGNYAIRNETEQTMTVRGNVSFYNSDNDKLQSSELIWDERKQLIYTDKFVKITRPIQQDTLYGLGFETDQSFKKIYIKHSVKGKLNADKLSEEFR